METPRLIGCAHLTALDGSSFAAPASHGGLERAWLLGRSDVRIDVTPSSNSAELARPVRCSALSNIHPAAPDPLGL